MNSFVTKALGGFVAAMVFVVALLALFGGSLNRVQSNEWGCLC